MQHSHPERSRLRRSLRLIAGCWLVLGWFLLGQAKAAIVYSGIVDIAITNTFEGVYLDLGNPEDNPYPDPDSVGNDNYTIGYSPTLPTWDVNFFFGGAGILHSESFSPFVDDTVGQGAQILNVTTGTTIQPLVAARTLGLGTGTNGASGNPVGGSTEDHFATPDLNNATFTNFTSGDMGYIAFQIDTGSGTQYGWMEVTLYNGGTTGTIHRWAYSDEANFEVGQIPEPSSFMLVLLASLGLLRRSRK